MLKISNAENVIVDTIINIVVVEYNVCVDIENILGHIIALTC